MMKRTLSSGGKRTWALLAALCLTLCLLAGCAAPAANPGASPTPTLTEAPAPTQGSETRPPVEVTESPAEGTEPPAERLVYVPGYEKYPATMDPITTRFPVERPEGVYFLRFVQTPEESGYRLMLGGKDAADPVTVASFPSDVYVDRAFPTEGGTLWVDRMDFTTGEVSLLEISAETGETLREVPFPAENGTVLGFFDLPDGSLGVSAMLPTGAQAAFQMDGEGKIAPLAAPVNEGMNFLLNMTFVGTAGSGLPEGECLAYDRESLFAFTPGSTDRRELLRWADIGVSAVNTMPLGMTEGVIRLLDARYGEYITLTPTPESAVPVREEVSMACLSLQGAVEDAVRDFNRRSSEYFIRVKDYSEGLPLTRDVQDKAVTALNLDVAAGAVPDLISLQEGLPFRSWAAKGLFRDLGPDLRGAGIELLPQLERIGSVDGALYMVSGSFALLTAIGSRDALGDLSGWTVGEAKALAASSPDCEGVFTSTVTRDFYMNYLSSYLEGFLDWDRGEASFDTPEFREMLDYAAALPVQGPAVSSTGDEEVMGGKALAAPFSITSVKQYQVRDLMYLGKLVCPGFPMPDRVGTLVYLTTPMAVSRSSAHPEGAVAFLRSMLDEAAQAAYTDFFPTTQTAFEAQLAEAMREPTPEEGYKKIFIFSNGGQFLDPTVYLWDGSQGERQPRTVLYWMNDAGGIDREEAQYAMSEEQRDALLRLLDASQRSSSYDQVISGIVQEEAGALFAGQRDPSEVARRIQARVELYLAEQG